MAFPDNVKYEIKVNDFAVVLTTEDPPYINAQTISYDATKIYLTIDIFDYDKIMPDSRWLANQISIVDNSTNTIIDSEGRNAFRIIEVWDNSSNDYTGVGLRVEVDIKPNTTTSDINANIDLTCYLLNTFYDPGNIFATSLTIPTIPVKQLCAKSSPETAEIKISDTSANIPSVVDQCYTLTGISPEFHNCVFEDTTTTPHTFYYQAGIEILSGNIEYVMVPTLSDVYPTSTSDILRPDIDLCPVTNFDPKQHTSKIRIWAISPQTGNKVYSPTITILQEQGIENDIGLLTEYNFDYTKKTSKEIKIIVRNKDIELDPTDAVYIKETSSKITVKSYIYDESHADYNVLYIYLSMPEFKDSVTDPADWETVNKFVRTCTLAVNWTNSGQSFYAATTLNQYHLTEYTNIPSWCDMLCIVPSVKNMLVNTDFSIYNDENELYMGSTVPYKMVWDYGSADYGEFLPSRIYVSVVNVKDIIQNYLNVEINTIKNTQIIEDGQYKLFYVYNNGLPIYRLNVYWDYDYKNSYDIKPVEDTPCLNRCIFNKASRKQYVFGSMISSMSEQNPLKMIVTSDNSSGQSSYLLNDITINQEASLLTVQANANSSYINFMFKPTPQGRSYTFERYEITDENYDYCLYYLNLNGGWDWLLLNDASTFGDDKTTSQYEFEGFSNGSNEYNFNTHNRKIYNIGTQFSHKWTVYTDLFLGDRIFSNYDNIGIRHEEILNVQEQSKLMRHVFLSPNLYLHDLKSGNIYAVNLSDSSMNYKTILSNGNKLFNYKLELTQAQKNNISY